MDLNPSDILRAEFEAWRQSPVTTKLLRTLVTIVDERHQNAINARANPAKAVEYLERECRIKNLFEFIQKGEFILQPEKQTLRQTL